MLLVVVLAAVLPRLQRGSSIAPQVTSTAASHIIPVPTTISDSASSPEAPLTATPPAGPTEPLPTSMVVRYQVEGFGYDATFVQPPPAPCDTVARPGHSSDEDNLYPVWYGEVDGQYLQVCAGEQPPPGADQITPPPDKPGWRPMNEGIVAVRTWQTNPWRDGKLAADVPYTDNLYPAPEAGEDLRLVSVEQNHLLHVESALLCDCNHLYLNLAKRQWQWVKYEGFPFSDAPPDMVVLFADFSLNVTRQQLDQQLAKWRAHGIKDYTMSLELEGYGGSFYHLDGPDFEYGDEGGYEVEMHGGIVQSFSFSYAHVGQRNWNPYIDRFTPTPAPTPDRMPIVQDSTIENQFARLDRMLSATKPSYCRVTFDDTYGFPNSFQCKRRPDETCCISIIQLDLIKVLKQGAVGSP